jgi:hydrocephalus-inducing protein
MIFEYTPDQVGTHEAYYTFEVPNHDISINFMLVGTVIEPNVFFNVGKVDFGPLLIGGKNKEIVKLKNLEEVPISFNFDKTSISGESDYGNSLTVFPISGSIKPNSEISIEITFQPQTECKYNYNLLCNMKRKSRPVSLNIKGVGYILDHSIYYGQ